MHPTAAPAATPPTTIEPLRRIARTTGLLYLALGITGMVGFLLVRPQAVGTDAAQTAVTLVDQETLARIGIALELGIVVSQALVSVWFYRLFRRIDHVAAGSLAAFGLLNAAALVGSVAAFGAALEISLDQGGGAAPGALVALSNNLWTVGGLFFGLWLLPMGLLALRASWLPDLLGRLLVVGGIGYVASTFLAYLAPDATWLVGLLVVPATVGELWMIGCLLGRPPRDAA